jgi:hypothetical protein
MVPLIGKDREAALAAKVPRPIAGAANPNQRLPRAEQE